MVRVLPKLKAELPDLSGTGFIANALPMPILLIGPRQEVIFANPAAEQFFDTGLVLLLKQRLPDLLPFDSPLFQLIAQAQERNSTAAERDVDLSTPRHGSPTLCTGLTLAALRCDNNLRWAALPILSPCNVNA